MSLFHRRKQQSTDTMIFRLRVGEIEIRCEVPAVVDVGGVVHLHEPLFSIGACDPHFDRKVAGSGRHVLYLHFSEFQSGHAVAC